MAVDLVYILMADERFERNDEVEPTDPRISHEAVVEFLMGRTFGKELEGMVRRSADFEQGLKVVFFIQYREIPDSENGRRLTKFGRGSLC